MFEISTASINIASAFTASTVSLAWVLRTLWRRFKKDEIETVKDRAEINIINVLQQQVATLSEENMRLRSTEAEVALRLGRLESKEQEVADHLIQIEKLHKRLDEKDLKIETMIKSHSEENTRMLVLLNIKDNEIRELYHKITNMEHILLNQEEK
jgi:hypothetical protein